jgi:hypothetical protein
LQAVRQALEMRAISIDAQLRAFANAPDGERQRPVLSVQVEFRPGVDAGGN